MRNQPARARLNEKPRVQRPLRTPFEPGETAGKLLLIPPRPLVREDEVSEPEDAPVDLDVLTFAGI